MSDLHELVEKVLIDEGYEVFLLPSGGGEVIAFENSLNFGFVFFYDTSADLIERWKEQSDECFSVYRLQIQKSGRKSWNAYAAFLCSETPSDRDFRKFSEIEENLSGVRKLARAVVASADGVRHALQPLLGLGYAPLLEPVDIEHDIRLISEGLPESSVDAFFKGARAEEILRLMGRSNEN